MGRLRGYDADAIADHVTVDTDDLVQENKKFARSENRSPEQLEKVKAARSRVQGKCLRLKQLEKEKVFRSRVQQKCLRLDGRDANNPKLLCRKSRNKSN